MADEKIKANEVLDDAELDKVAGGYSDETYEDLESLRVHLGIDCAHGYDHTTCLRLLKDNYANAGILFKHHDNGPNEYYDINTGRQMSHSQAMNAFVKIGRDLNRY